MKALFATLVFAFALPAVARSSGYEQALISREPAAFAIQTCKNANGNIDLAKKTLLDAGWVKSNELDDIIQFWTHYRYVSVRAKLSRKSNSNDWSDETIKASYPPTMFSSFDELQKVIKLDNSGLQINYERHEKKSDWVRRHSFYKTDDGKSAFLIEHNYCYYLGHRNLNPILIDAFHKKKTWTTEKSASGLTWYFQKNEKLRITVLTDDASTPDPRLPTEYDLYFRTSFPQ